MLFGAPFLWIRSRIRYPAIAAFFILVFATGQIGASSEHLSTVRTDHLAYSKAVAAMLGTGEKYWISDFWGSYLLTSLSGEKLIVASYGVRRYYPYELWYWSEGKNNWVFLKDRNDMDVFAVALTDTLKRTGVGFREIDTGRFALIYAINQDVFPKIILADPPRRVPEVRLESAASSTGRLDLGFVRSEPGSAAGLGFMAEIPGYSARFIPIPESASFTVDIPFPESGTFSVKYGLTYAGLQLPGSMRERSFTLGPADLAQPRRPIEFLQGIGPQRSVLGRRMSICAKEASLEVSEPTDTKRDLILELFSPFDFDHPFWYGDFSQSVSISVNDRLLGERPLAYGENRVVIKRTAVGWRGRGDIVRLRFRYAMPVSMNENWKTAAFLERVDLEQSP